ncbi:hypothetical protein AQUCO_01700045v1 [Aquilegia coerulea]|uniref:Myb/SANT-like domain-containing protein n=1 Tax=Aquilegia coerulea TaxID=218851 RepID=A0A2G5DKY5_AQUCA|nr:hypothetical protein AQUCO_01700045v1 [Aquilegia coerulea]
MDGNELQSDVDSMGKGKQLRWDFAMDSALINTLVEAAKQGHKQGCFWHKHVWDAVIDAVYTKTNQLVEKKHIENRVRQMKGEYNIFAELKGMPGFEWDPVKQIITAPYERWEELIKQKSKYKSFRDRGPKWDLEKLSIIVGNEQVTTDVMAVAVAVKDQNVDDVNDSVSVSTTGYIGKRLLPSMQKRQHGKKTRIIKSVQEMIEGMNVRIEQIAKSVDPMSFSNTLYAEVMKTEGFSPEYLDSAFALLRRDPLEAEIFLVRTVDFRKKMLEGLREKIGNM